MNCNSLLVIINDGPTVFFHHATIERMDHPSSIHIPFSHIGTPGSRALSFFPPPWEVSFPFPERENERRRHVRPRRMVLVPGWERGEIPFFRFICRKKSTEEKKRRWRADGKEGGSNGQSQSGTRGRRRRYGEGKRCTVDRVGERH